MLGFESGLERQVRAMFLVRPDVVDIIDQPFEILAVDDQGKPCTKIPDFWIKFVDGSSSAIEVKPMSRVKALEFEQELEFFSQFLQPDQADEIILVNSINTSVIATPSIVPDIICSNMPGRPNS